MVQHVVDNVSLVCLNAFQRHTFIHIGKIIFRFGLTKGLMQLVSLKIFKNR